MPSQTSQAVSRRSVMGGTVQAYRPLDHLLGGDPVARAFGRSTGLSLSSAVSYLKSHHPSRVALALAAFREVGHTARMEAFAAPFRAELEAIDVPAFSDDLILEKAASDGLEDTCRDEFLCWRDIKSKQRWLRALAQERRDNLRLTLAAQRGS